MSLASFKSALAKVAGGRAGKVFVTGRIRQEYFDGTLEASLQASLLEATAEQGLTLEYLSPEKEMELGFLALQNSIPALRRVVLREDEPLREGFRFIVIQSGSTTAQVALLEVTGHEILEVRRSATFPITSPQAIVDWIGAQYKKTRLVFDSGAPSYTIRRGVDVATKVEDLEALGANPRTVAARAYAEFMLSTMKDSGFDYRLVARTPEYKLESSPALGDPDCVVDWGGGQLQNPRTGVKEAFDQEAFLNACRE